MLLTFLNTLNDCICYVGFHSVLTKPFGPTVIVSESASKGTTVADVSVSMSLTHIHSMNASVLRTIYELKFLSPKTGN